MAVQPWRQHGAQPFGAGQADWTPAATPQSAMRAAHTDRDRTIDVLKAAFAEGRLTADEYSQRFEAVAQARTYGELAGLVADLPAGPMVAPAVAPVAVVPSTFLAPSYQPRPVARTNGLAGISLALGILGFPTMGLLGLPAVITGHLARKQIRELREEGEGMALAGTVLGWLAIGGWAMIFLLGVLLGA